jgi:uracil-DNA glycosylase
VGHPPNRAPPKVQESMRKRNFFIRGFHQSCIHKILARLDKAGKKWVFTDLVKYYVDNGKKFESAAKSCIQYLKRQIEILRPRVVLMFGSDVQRLIEKHLVANRDKRLWHNWHERKNQSELHGEIIEVKPEDLKNLKVKTTLVYSVFPTGRNADPLVGWERKRSCLRS